MITFLLSIGDPLAPESQALLDGKAVDTAMIMNVSRRSSLHAVITPPTQ